MIFQKVKYLKNGMPQGRAYTFKSELYFPVDSTVVLEGGEKGIIVNEPIDPEQIKSFGEENIKSIIDIVQEEEKE